LRGVLHVDGGDGAFRKLGKHYSLGERLKLVVVQYEYVGQNFFNKSATLADPAHPRLALLPITPAVTSSTSVIRRNVFRTIKEVKDFSSAVAGVFLPYLNYMLYLSHRNYLRYVNYTRYFALRLICFWQPPTILR
jgi:hypothetical protein